MNKIGELLKYFQIEGNLKNIEIIEKGNLNQTYLSNWSLKEKEHKYIHQAINTRVFKKPLCLMYNIEYIIHFLKSKNKEYKSLEIVYTKNNDLILQISKNIQLRTYKYVENSMSYDFPLNKNIAYSGSKFLANFLDLLNDIDQQKISSTIPNFFNLKKRVLDFNKAFENDLLNRKINALKAIKFDESKIPLILNFNKNIHKDKYKRVIHGDLKFNNLLYDQNTNEPICVIDLDTCMRGPIFYDFGDLVRTASVNFKEDENDISKIKLNLEYLESIVKGFKDGFKKSFNQKDIDLYVIAPFCITYVLGLRFFQDFLMGDKYFQIHYPDQNLIRARNQFILAEQFFMNGNKISEFLKSN